MRFLQPIKVKLNSPFRFPPLALWESVELAVYSLRKFDAVLITHTRPFLLFFPINHKQREATTEAPIDRGIATFRHIGGVDYCIYKQYRSRKAIEANSSFQ